MRIVVGELVVAAAVVAVAAVVVVRRGTLYAGQRELAGEVDSVRVVVAVAAAVADDDDGDVHLWDMRPTWRVLACLNADAAAYPPHDFDDRSGTLFWTWGNKRKEGDTNT